jgi:GT2 family glycosyltransferase
MEGGVEVHGPMTHDLSIAAVFATMNRAETARECVLALARQTRPPASVIVADNVSQDGTAQRLEDLGCLPFELVVHRMKENRGNAGGVEEAMDLAFARGADAVWILDDDSWPRMGALEALLEGEWNPAIVRHALQIDPQTGRFSWPLWVACGSGWMLAFDESELPDGPLLRSKASWTGALISKLVRQRVGPVQGALFIRGEDEEYPWRIEQAGISFEAVRAAVMDHPGPKDLIHWHFAGKNFFFERGLAEWKLYYRVRNRVWLKRRQSGTAAAIRMALAYAAATMVIDGPRRVAVLWRAVRDGWRGRLGRMR